jgi:hypothetical protein
MPRTLALILLPVFGLLAPLLSGCGGLPATGGAASTTSGTVVVTIGPSGTQNPLDVAAVVICGGIRAVYAAGDPWVMLKGVPFGTLTPPRQPLSVTATGYRTYSQTLEMNVSTATYVDCPMEKVSLSDTGTVSGQVTDLQTGKPIAAASVQFLQESAGNAVTVEGFTDTSGNYIIGGIPVGTNHVLVQAINYIQSATDIVVGQDSGGGSNAPFNAQLIAGAARVEVHGTVVDLATQQPIVGASVKLADQSTTTNSAGAFKFTDMPVGPADLVVTAAGYDEYAQTLSLLPAMGALRIEMTVASPNPPPPPHNLTGTVTVHNRPDNSGALVSAYNLRAGIVMAAYTTGADGVYYLLVPPGDYEIRVDYGPIHLVRALTVPGGGRIVTGIDFTLTAP